MEEPARAFQRPAAVAIAVAVTACAVAGVTAAALLDFSRADAFGTFLATNATMGLTFGLCGALVAWHRPHNPVGWLLGADGLGHAISAAAGPGALLAQQHGAPIGVQRLLVTVFVYSWPWSIALFLPLTLLLLPDGRLLSPRWRYVGWGTVLTAPVFVLEMGAGPDSPVAGMPPGYLTLPAYDDLSWLWNLAELRNVVLLFLALVVLVLRYRRGADLVRRQLLWLVLATVCVLTAVVFWAFVRGTPTAVLFTIPLIPIAVAVAVLRHNLLDIRLLLSRTLVYVVLSGAVFAVYAGLVVVLDSLVDAKLGAGVLSALVIAVAFGPARTRLQRAVDRRLYGDRRDPARAMTRVGSQLGADGGLPGVVAALRESMRFPYVAIRTPERVLAEAGAAPAGALVELPLDYGGTAVGSLVLGPRRGESTLAPADRALLDVVAAPLALAVHATRLTADLQRSRERAATAREEERRRLRRDLHDGLGPRLTGVALRADAAANLLDTDPDEVRRLLTALGGDARTAIADIRRLVYGLRPPVLDQLGLVGALAQQLGSLRREDGAPIGAALDTAGFAAMAALPTAVEVAAYRIATEAVANAARHSSATRVVVRLDHDRSPDGAHLVVEVCDDGRAINGAWHPGVGLTAMHERADELGGSCAAGPTATGGRVLARLPVEAP
jgi:two-component system, NarL family, sensor kinase